MLWMRKHGCWTCIKRRGVHFPMAKKAYGGTKTRDALSRADMRRFLDFVQTDKHFCKYYDGIYILFNTGLRISEFCGLTRDDIDFTEHVIHVRRQLLRVHDGHTNKYYIEEPKTHNGVRDVPMMPDVEKAFQNVIANRPVVNETVVWDELHQQSMTGFLWVDKDGHYEVAQHWSNHLRWARTKFNKIYKDEAEALYRRECHNQALNELFKTNGLLVMEAEQFVRSNPYPDGRAQKLLLEMQEILNRKLVDSMSDF